MQFLRFVQTLKFRIIAVAVLASVLAAIATTSLALDVTRTELQKQLLDNDRQERERTAALLSSKLETLKYSLTLVAHSARPALAAGSDAMTSFLLGQPSLGALFDTVLAATPDGALMTRIVKGEATTELPSIADRAYFRQVMTTDQAVVSDPLPSKIQQIPVVIVAAPILSPEGKPVGMLAGALRLRSNGLFTDPMAARADGVRDLVMDRNGVLLSHSNSARVLGHAQDEPGLGAVFSRWKAAGSPIDTQATAELSQDHLVSMAGIPLSDWVLVRLTPRASALSPMQRAYRTAQESAVVAGLVAALLAGGMAWAALSPIARLQARAERMLAQGDASAAGWPEGAGEIGEMSRAFQQLLLQNERQRGEMHDLLQQLHAVLDNAEVGIALTRNGRFEMVSRQFLAIFGYQAGQTDGMASCDVYPSAAAYEAFSQRAQPAFMQHGMFDGETQLRRSNGELFWAHMRGRAVEPGDRSRGTIWVIADITQAHQQREKLAWAAGHDALTGLANRATFEVLLETATAQAAEQPFCALFIDLDRFKQVNDTGGHAAGDALLRGIAHVLSSHLRKSDTVARLGGDEFAVLLPHCPAQRAQAIAQTLRASVESYRLPWEGERFAVGASIGLVACAGQHEHAADVMRAADVACYEAKRLGRNRVAMA